MPFPRRLTSASTTITAEGETAYNVPAGTASLEVTVIGAEGGGVVDGAGPVGTGGQGAEVGALITVPAGVSTLYVEVGGSDGTGGAGTSDYAGYGGGESAIQTCAAGRTGCLYTANPSTDPRLVVAAGGGGGGEDTLSAGSDVGGAGGNAGSTSSVTGPGTGGNGNDAGNGAAGGNAGFETSAATSAVGQGSAGCATAGNGTAGSPSQAGTGGPCDEGTDSSGGGGGAGWVGGSGGGAGDYAAAGGAGGGGGAGSSFVESSATDVSISSAGSSTPEVEITPTSVAPTITSAAATTFTAGQAGSFTVTTTGAPSGPTLRLSESAIIPSGVSFTDNGDGTATIAGTPAAGSGGRYAFTIAASNGVSPDYNQAFTLTVDEAPAITSAPSRTFTTGESGTCNISASGYPAAVVSDGGASLPSGVSFVTSNGRATISGTPAAGTGGSHRFTITASNGIGTAATQIFTLLIDQSPGITSTADATFTTGKTSAFNIATTGYPAASVADAGAPLPRGLSFVDNQNGTATISGTPAAGGGGSYPLTITAANGTTPDATQAFTLAVNEAPGFTSAADATFVVGTNATFTVLTSGYPHAALSDGNAGLPAGVSYIDNQNGTATVSGTPAAGTAGSYPLTITAANGTGPDASQAFTLTVDQPLSIANDQPPSITSGSKATFIVGRNAKFTVRTSGLPVAALSLGSARLPSGVSFVDNHNGTATIAGRATARGAGTYHLTIAASNSVAPAARQSFTLTVDEAALITSAKRATFVVGKPGAFVVRANGFPAGSALRISEQGARLPAGLSFVDHGGAARISGAPAFGTAGRYLVTLRASNGVAAAGRQVFALSVDNLAGYAVASSKGGVRTFGAVRYHGSAAHLRLKAPIVGVAVTPNGRGYWLVGSNGGVFSFGSAHFLGSLPRRHLHLTDVVGITSMPDGHGYWLLSRTGSVYAFGDARLHGDLPGRGVRVSDVVAMAATRDGKGYYLARRDRLCLLLRRRGQPRPGHRAHPCGRGDQPRLRDRGLLASRVERCRARARSPFVLRSVDERRDCRAGRLERRRRLLRRDRQHGSPCRRRQAVRLRLRDQYRRHRDAVT